MPQGWQITCLVWLIFWVQCPVQEKEGLAIQPWSYPVGLKYLASPTMPLLHSSWDVLFLQELLLSATESPTDGQQGKGPESSNH